METIPAAKKTLSEDWISSFVKYKNPILKPVSKTFYSKAIFNPTVIKENGIIYLLFRASNRSPKLNKAWSEIGLAFSKDGVKFNIYPQPILSPKYDYEKYGCQDPRIVKFDKTYYLTYTGRSGKYNESRICLATSKDLIHWKKHGKILSEKKFKWNSGNKKAAVIVPKKINNKYVMYFMGEQKPWQTAIGIAYSADLIDWHETNDKLIILPRKDYFDSQGVEPGPTPIITKEGILLFYNGWNKRKTHRTGTVLLSKKDPTKILKRTISPILESTLNWEKDDKSYKSRNVVFSEGLAEINNRLYLYYGAIDIYIGLAMSKK